jgi:DNA polymerase-3 subunit alpha
MMGDDAVGSSTQEPPWPMCCPGASRSADAGKDGIGFYLSGHLFDEVEAEVRRFVRTPMAELATAASRSAGRHRQRSARHQRPARQAGLFKLDDKSAVIEASGRSHAQRPRPAQGRRVCRAFGACSPTASAAACAGAAGVEPGRCALPFGRYLQVSVGKDARCPRLLREFPAKGGNRARQYPARAEGAPGVRCQSSGAAQVELQLGETAASSQRCRAGRLVCRGGQRAQQSGYE